MTYTNVSSCAPSKYQITQDLVHFWDETYFEVKKEMKGRYPKHYWPDDPYRATATHRVRPK
ncbi:MAG: ATP-dependent helicase C-terminal domain-containing protein [Longimonas sp.]